MSISNVITKGDKVYYQNQEYYYIGFSEGMHVLGDRFLRPMIGLEKGDEIEKAKLMTKTDLMHGLVEYRDIRQKDSPGIANIVQLLIDILNDDMEKSTKTIKLEV